MLIEGCEVAVDVGERVGEATPSGYLVAHLIAVLQCGIGIREVVIPGRTVTLMR